MVGSFSESFEKVLAPLIIHDKKLKIGKIISARRSASYFIVYSYFQPFKFSVTDTTSNFSSLDIQN